MKVMSDYIKREDALKALREYPVTKLKTAIRRLPSADVAPFNHGHWIKHEAIIKGVKDSIECSACGVWIDDMPRKTFCPNCGSIMYRYGDEDDD